MAAGYNAANAPPNYVPKPEVMDRNGRAPSAKKGLLAAIFCPCIGERTTASTRFARNEIVFYDSAKAQRTLLGKMHYCLACPGWSKLTTQRVVYSRWVSQKARTMPTPSPLCQPVPVRSTAGPHPTHSGSWRLLRNLLRLRWLRSRLAAT